jgi:uncharacterized protein
MARILMLSLLAAVLVWLLVGRRDRVGGSRESARAKPPQQPTAFAQCAHCGVHLPMGEAVLEGATAYCSQAHRLAGPRG